MPGTDQEAPALGRQPTLGLTTKVKVPGLIQHCVGTSSDDEPLVRPIIGRDAKNGDRIGVRKKQILRTGRCRHSAGFSMRVGGSRGGFRARDDLPQRRSPDPTVPNTPARPEPSLQTTFAMDDDDTESVASRNSGHEMREEMVGTANRIRRLRLVWDLAQDVLPEVRTAATLIRSLAARVGPVPIRGNVPSAIRRQRWSPLNVPLMWAAAGHQESCPLLEWTSLCAVRSRVMVTHGGEQHEKTTSHATELGLTRSVNTES